MRIDAKLLKAIKIPQDCLMPLLNSAPAVVKPDGYLRCTAESEGPAALGFAAAALRVSRKFRVAQSIDGAPTAGRRIRRTIVFRLAD